MAEIEVPVYCYWNGCIKYGPEGVYYEGPTPKKIIVNPKIAFSRLLDEMYVLTGVDIDKKRSRVRIFGRYPSVVQQSKFQYLLLPVVNNNSLETMLKIPSKHPSIKNAELYLEVISDGVVDPGSSSKRQRTNIPIKLERDNMIEEEADADFGNVGGGDMTYKISGSDTVPQVVNLTGNNMNSHKYYFDSRLQKHCVELPAADLTRIDTLDSLSFEPPRNDQRRVPTMAHPLGEPSSMSVCEMSVGDWREHMDGHFRRMWEWMRGCPCRRQPQVHHHVPRRRQRSPTHVASSGSDPQAGIDDETKSE